MASYIGVSPPEQTGIVERYKYTGDGSATAFSGADTNAKVLRYTSTNPVLVFLNGVQLVEGTDFTKTSNTVLTFAAAPANNDEIEILTFGSFNLNSPATIRCDLGLNTTDSPTFNGLTTSGSITTPTINSSSTLNIDTVGAITLDSEDIGRILLKHTGTTYGHILRSGQSLELKSSISDGDFEIHGVDGGSAIVALRLDMSEAGSAIFNNDVKLGDSGKLTLGASDDLQIYHDASNSYIKDAGTGDLRIESSFLRAVDTSNSHTTATFASSGVALRHSNSVKLQTTSTGATITGTLLSDGLTVDTNTLYVDATNNRVGIGTASPAIHLDVQHTAADVASFIRSNNSGAGQIRLGNSDGFVRLSGEDGSFAICNSNNTVNRFNISNTGNIGIGTASPTYTLHSLGSGTDGALGIFHNQGSGGVYSGVQIASDNQLGGGNSDTNLTITRWNGTGTKVAAVKIGVVANNNDGVLTFSTAENADLGSSSYTERMRIDGDTGNIGIGTTSPLRELHVAGGANMGIALTSSGQTNNIAMADTIGSVRILHNSGALHFKTGGSANSTASGTDALSILSNRKVGIGTASPSTLLHLSSSDPQITITDTDGTGSQVIKAVGNNLELLSSNQTILNSASTIFLDSNNGLVLYNVGATEYMRVNKSSNDAIIKSSISDGDLIFKGNDGGSEITALSFDMSDAGSATFNNNLTVAGDLTVNGTTTTLNTATLDIEDKTLCIAKGAADAAAANGAGVIVDGASACLCYTSGTDSWDFNKKVIVNGKDMLVGNSANNHEIALCRVTSSPSSIKLQAHSNEPKIMFGTNGAGTYGLRFSDTNDNVLMKLTTTGLLGIGTSSPTQKLTIAGGNSAKIAFIEGGVQSLYFNDTDTSLAGYFHYQHSIDQFRMNTSGNIALTGGPVGIGTVSPNNYSGYGNITLNGTSGGIFDLEVNGTRTGSLLGLVGETRLASITNIPVTFQVNNAEKMRLNSTGLGIFNSNPSTPIHITSNTPVITFEEIDQSNRKFQIGSFGNAYAINDSTNSQFRYVLENSGNHIFNEGGVDSDFRVESNNNTHMLFVDGGQDRVGIGESAPLGKFHITSAGSGGSVNGVADELVIEGSGRSGMTILSGSSSIGTIAFGDSGSSTISSINYDHSSNNLNFYTNGAERVRIASGGDVGIGITNPVTRLEVNLSGTGETLPIVLSNRNTTAGTGQRTTLGFGLARNSGAFKSQAGTIEVGREQDWTNADNNIDSFMAFSTYLNNAGSEKMRITSDGSLAIGATSAQATLHIVRTDVGALNDGNSNGLMIEDTNAGISIGSSTTGEGHIYFSDSADADVGGISYFHNSNDLKIRVNAAERMRINSSGQVGLGTSNPGYPLQINSSTQSTLLHLNSTGATSSAITFANTGSNDSIAISAESDDLKLRTDDGVIKFFTNENSEAMRITSAGKIAIGTTSEIQDFGSARKSLSIKGSGSGDYSNIQLANYGTSGNDQYHGFINFYDGGNSVSRVGSQRESSTSNAYLTFWTSSGSGITERVRIDSSGKVGIGTSAPSQRLEVSSSANNIIKSKTTTSTAIGGFEAWNNSTAYMKIFTYGSSATGSNFGGVANANVALLESQQVSNVVFSTWSNAGGSNPDFIFAPQRTLKVIIKSDGKVGVGTSSPETLMHIKGDSTTIDGGTSTGTLRIRDSGTGATARTVGRIQFLGEHSSNSADGNRIFAQIEAQKESSTSGGTDGRLIFKTNSGVSSAGQAVEVARFDSNGKLGIGTSDPLGRLHVETGSSGTSSVSVSHDELVVEGSGNAGITILAGGSNLSGIAFGDSADPDNGRINYLHSDTSMRFIVAAQEFLKIDSSGDILPGSNDAQDLGSASLQWRNIYTGDLHLNNENKIKGNDFDGTRGNWTIQEGEEDLFIKNNRTGKKYRFKLEEFE